MTKIVLKNARQYRFIPFSELKDDKELFSKMKKSRVKMSYSFSGAYQYLEYTIEDEEIRKIIDSISDFCDSRSIGSWSFDHKINQMIRSNDSFLMSSGSKVSKIYSHFGEIDIILYFEESEDLDTFLSKYVIIEKLSIFIKFHGPCIFETCSSRLCLRPFS